MNASRTVSRFPPLYILNAILGVFAIIGGGFWLGTAFNLDGGVIATAVGGAVAFLIFLFSRDVLHGWVQGFFSHWSATLVLLILNSLFWGLFVVQAQPEPDPTPTPTPTVTTQIPETETPTDAPTAPTELPIAFSELEVHWNLAFMVLYNASGNSIPKDEIMKLRFEAITRNTVILTGSVWNNQTDSNWSVLRPGRCLVVFNMAQTAEAPSLTDVSIEVPACNTLEEVTVYVGVVAARAAWYPGYEGFNVFYEDTRIAACTEEPCILPQASMQE